MQATRPPRHRVHTRWVVLAAAIGGCTSYTVAGSSDETGFDGGTGSNGDASTIPGSSSSSSSGGTSTSSSGGNSSGNTPDADVDGSPPLPPADLERANWLLPATGNLSYTVEAEVATDAVTGLRWQRTPLSVRNLANANTACNDLVLGGLDDWRLPTATELFSIVDVTQSDPSLKPGIFLATPTDAAAWFWTASAVAGDPTGAHHAVHFAGGGGYSKSYGPSFALTVRCVSTPLATPHAERLLPGTDSVTDAYTGLRWQRVPSAFTGNQAAAIAHCSALVLEGADDWRAPTMMELQTLVNRRVANPSIDVEAFPGTQPTGYWTRAGLTDYGGHGWSVSFAFGHSDRTEIETVLPVRCVH